MYELSVGLVLLDRIGKEGAIMDHGCCRGFLHGSFYISLRGGGAATWICGV